MVKRLTALLLCSLFATGSVFAEEMMTKEASAKSEGKRSVYNRRKNGNGKKAETVVATEDTYTQARGTRYNGSSCNTGGCNKVSNCNKGNCGQRGHSHACRESNCHVCTRKSIPNKPCCEKAVTVRAEPCLHKHIEYSWTCPATYAEAACNPCD